MTGTVTANGGPKVCSAVRSRTRPFKSFDGPTRFGQACPLNRSVPESTGSAARLQLWTTFVRAVLTVPPFTSRSRTIPKPGQ